MPYFQIVTFGSPIWGTRRNYYRNPDNAIRDARTLSGGTLTNVQVVKCVSRADALAADISEYRPVVWSR